MKRLILAFLICAFPMFLLNDCKKDKGDPPSLPPFETMVVDFSNFTSLKKSGPADVSVKGTESSTWQFAANIVTIWNTLITDNTTIPMDAYQAALTGKPAFVSENLWQWSYNFVSGADNYSAKLTGKISSASVTWKLMISSEGTSFKNFIWLEGTSKTDGSQGQWKFHQSPSTDVQIFQTDWSKSGDEVTAVLYTYSKNDTFKNSYINYHLSTSGFDAGYLIHFSDGSYSDSEIEWNFTTRDGRLNCVDYLQDNSWYCWDTNKINKICE
jgi:hypothetical protein